MITTGSRFWFAVTGLTLIGAAVYFLASGGEKYGTVVLGFAAAAAMIPGIASVVLRDGDVAAATTRAPAAEHRPAATRFAAAWPALAALGAGVTIVGLAAGGALFYVGLGILGVTLVEWMVQGWAERSTGDPAVNQALRHRIMYPIEIPALAVIGIAVAVIAFSRVLLALPKTGSTVVAMTVATLILGVAILLSARPKLSSTLLTVVVLIGAVGLLGGGIVGAVAGEREFEEHGAEEGGEHGAEEGGEHGAEGGGYVVVATDAADFETSELVVPAGEPITVTFENNDEVASHNLHIEGVGGGTAATPIIGPGETAELELTVEAGEYRYICDVHPTTMIGTLAAEELTAGDVEEVEGGSDG
ncbi:MAG: cupredoxin domain-containing protein [Acidimicrobiales bacterium]